MKYTWINEEYRNPFQILIQKIEFQFFVQN